MCLGGLFAQAATNDGKPEESPAPRPAQAPWSLSIDLTFADKDFGRPLRVFGPVFQQNVNFEYRFGGLGTIGINSWADLDLTDTNGHAGRYSELDTSAYWRHDLAPLGSLELGYIRFDYPEERSSSWIHEAYARIKAKFLLKPSFAAHRDVGPYEGWYLKAEVSHRFPLEDVLGSVVKDWSFELGGNASWGDGRTIRRFFLRSDNRTEASFIGASETGALHVPLFRSGGRSVTLSPYFTVLERVPSTAPPRTSWLLGVGLNLGF